MLKANFVVSMGGVLGGHRNGEIADRVVAALKAEFGDADILPPRGDAIEIGVIVKPTTQDLIDAWHLVPSGQNHDTLWNALSPGVWFRSESGQGSYRAVGKLTPDGDRKVIEVY